MYRSNILNISVLALLRSFPVRHKSLVRHSATRYIGGTRPNMEGKCKVTFLDHLVLTVGDLNRSIDFYTSTLGMQLVQFGEGRKALKFGTQKINLHLAGKEFKPYAKSPTPGSADLCFVSNDPLPIWIEKLDKLGVSIEEGPVARTGAEGPINSIYVRDPDGNLIEICNYQ